MIPFVNSYTACGWVGWDTVILENENTDTFGKNVKTQPRKIEMVNIVSLEWELIAKYQTAVAGFLQQIRWHTNRTYYSLFDLN